jgi:hypothetical protein
MTKSTTLEIEIKELKILNASLRTDVKYYKRALAIVKRELKQREGLDKLFDEARTK